MKRLLWLAAAPLFVGPLWPQEKIVATRVFVEEPCGRTRARFWVDGVLYNGPVTLFWPENSKHIISYDPQNEVTENIRCTFSGWVDSKGNAMADGPTIAVTAHPDITYYKATSRLEYGLNVQIGGGLPFSCTQGPDFGKLYVGGSCYAESTIVWVAAGSTVTLQAYPPKGYIFVGWNDNISLSSAPQITTFTVNNPMLLAPRFEPAVRVTIKTDPPGLRVMADRTEVITPITLDWGQNTKHVLAPLPYQMDVTGQYWVFESWSNGGAAQQIYVPRSPTNVPEEITAKHVRGVNVSFLTNPHGLKLLVDGRDWTSYNFIWGVNSKHTVAAPAEQVGPNGRRYVWTGWSNNGEATQEIIVPEIPEEATGFGLRLTASYEMLARLRVRSEPAELGILVNGSECKTPCMVEPRQGTQIRLAAPASISYTDWHRLDFQGWADGGPRERTWTAGPDEQTLTANYRWSYRVKGLVDPAEGAAIRIEPPSPDGFYPADSDITLIAEPKPGYRFKYWDGDQSGNSRSLTVRTSSPKIVRAVLEPIPYVPPSGVRNAAAETPQPGVAPGSLIAVYGVNLAPAYVEGPASPLAQVIAGVTVSVGDRLLPLVFVSPEQINAQLPSDLKEGEYTLTVRNETQPEAVTKFLVVRNAPGLFANTADGRPLALGFKEDGSLLGFDRPARRGETVTLLGTGFGPYQSTPPDGFPVFDAARLALIDPVEVLVGERVVRPEWAGAAVGHVGVTAIRLRITQDFPAGASLELRMRVNGKESNTVLLPIE